MKSLQKEKIELFSDLRGLVFDVDDTVTRDGVLEAEAFSALHKLNQAGFVLIAATGRPIGFVEIMVRQWPISLGVGENGAAWVSKEPGATIQRGYFLNHEQIADEIRQQSELKRKLLVEFPEFRLTRDSWARECDLAYDIGEHDQHSPERITALTELMRKEGAYTTVSSVHAHAMFNSIDKAVGVERALQQVYGENLQSNLDRWLFVGDSGNDAAAFAYFQMTVGVANVREHLNQLKVSPQWITEQDRGKGFAELADCLLRARGL